MLKSVLINEGESNRKLLKMLAGENVNVTKKVSRTDLI